MPMCLANAHLFESEEQFTFFAHHDELIAPDFNKYLCDYHAYCDGSAVEIKFITAWTTVYICLRIYDNDTGLLVASYNSSICACCDARAWVYHLLMPNHDFHIRFEIGRMIEGNCEVDIVRHFTIVLLESTCDNLDIVHLGTEQFIFGAYGGTRFGTASSPIAIIQFRMPVGANKFYEVVVTDANSGTVLYTEGLAAWRESCKEVTLVLYDWPMPLNDLNARVDIIESYWDVAEVIYSETINIKFLGCVYGC